MACYRHTVLSAKELAAVTVAVEICNNIKLKTEILSGTIRDENWDSRYVKRQWKKNVEKQASTLLSNLNLPIYLPEEVISIVPSIGKRMLIWAEYHEGTIGFSRKDSIYLLKSSFFTQQGNIDNKIAAETLIYDPNLSIKQKCMIACMYCLTDEIDTLFRQMNRREKEKFYKNLLFHPLSINHFGLAELWYNLLENDEDKLRGEKPLLQMILQRAIESGNLSAVKYCFERLKVTLESNTLVDAAEEAVKCRLITMQDWIVFRRTKFDGNKEPWVPNDYYIDILCYLLSKMSRDQQIEFFKKDINGANYGEEEALENPERSRVLEYFLDSPYQDYFMKTAELMWDFLPESTYAILLLNICDKIESKEDKNFKYFEEKIYDYRGLLRQFWDQSPERYKRYVFSNKCVVFEIVYLENEEYRNEGRAGYWLLFKLMRLKNFTHEDQENIMLILASANDEDKKTLIDSFEWKFFYLDHLRREKREILDWFVKNCFSTKEQANAFTRKLIFHPAVLHFYVNLLKNGKWHMAVEHINRSALPGEDINQLMIEIIYTNEFKRGCMDLVSNYEDVEVATKFFKCVFTSDEQVIEFKKDLIFSKAGMEHCLKLVQEDKIGLVDEIISRCLHSQEEVNKFKKDLEAHIKRKFRM